MRQFVLGMLLIGSSASFLLAEDRPNFVLFIADDISWDDIGCYGPPTIKTPHIDRLAASGLRFTNAYLTISSCSPSRCSLITGRYPHNCGAPELHTNLPEGQVLFPELLKDAGYFTVLTGKHHMGNAANRAFSKVSRGRGPGKESDWVELLANRPQDRPFFSKEWLGLTIGFTFATIFPTSRTCVSKRTLAARGESCGRSGPPGG